MSFMNMKKYSTLIVMFLAALTIHAQDWEQVASYPGDARHHPVTFAIDNYGYLLTGSNNDNDFFRYDSDIDTWEQMTDFPGQGRGFSYGVSYEGIAYMGFGANNNEFLDGLNSNLPNNAINSPKDAID